jgi:hypothetical protein
METDIQFLRLKNGEDILAEVQETATTYILLNPCKVLYLKGSKPGFISLSLMQWVFMKICSEQVFEIVKEEVLFKSYPDENLVAHYWNSVEHFMNSASKDNIEYDRYSNDEGTYDESNDLDEGIELLKKLLESKDDKGKLH